MLNRSTWPVYEFTLVYATRRSRELGQCRVTLYAEGLPRPTVVITELSQNRGPSATNNVETVCGRIRTDYLEPLGIDSLRVCWLQRHLGRPHDEQWSEVSFEGYDGSLGRYVDPSWEKAEAVSFNWESLRPSTAVHRARRLVAAQDVDPDDLHFTSDECYLTLTGVCSLEGTKGEDIGDGRSNFHYCGKLAVLCRIWELARRHCGGDIPTEDEAIEKLQRSPALAQYVTKEWDSRFGPLPPLRKALPDALALFGTAEMEQVELMGDGSGLLKLSDGRHRLCIAQHLGVRIAAIVEWEEPVDDR